jgi:hypothetical protein
VAAFEADDSAGLLVDSVLLAALSLAGVELDSLLPPSPGLVLA